MQNTIQALLRAGSFSAAKSLINKEMSDNPEDPGCWRLLVLSEILQGNHKTASGLLDKALQIAPNDRELRELELSNLYWLGKRRAFQRKIDVFELSFPPDVDTFFMRGMYEAKWGNIKTAKLMLTKLQSLGARQEWANHLQMQIYGRRSNWFGIRRILESRREVDPNDLENHRQYAWAEFNLLRFASARRSARQAMSLSQDRREYSALIFFSYLVYFPPFFLAHFYWFMMGLFVRNFENDGGDFLLYYLGGKLIIIPGALCLGVIDWLGIPNGMLISILLFFAWLPFPPLILPLTTWLSKRKPKVILAGY